MNLQNTAEPILGEGEAWDPVHWDTLGVTAHPVAPLPGEAWLRTHTLEELLEFINEREETIHRMQQDPFRYGWEPLQWKILDALCGFPWADPSEADIRRERDPAARAQLEKKRAWCLTVRRVLIKQDEPLRVLLLNGGNRAGKSEWAAIRMMRLLMGRDKRRAWAFHQDEAMSREYQQEFVWKYMPAELRSERGLRRGVTYIAYKKQTGFSDSRFVLPNASDCSFRNYSQDFAKIQGGELDLIWCDELVPAAWVKELKARVATRGGWLLITFTPIEGYTPTVKMFLDAAEVTRKATAFVLPTDGKEQRKDLAMMGDDASAWIEPGRRGQPPVPEGRRFEEVERCMRLPGDRRSGVFFFHCWDNPFGNPSELYELHKGDSAQYRKMKFYGKATKSAMSQFAKFNPDVHIVDEVPKDGTNYMVVDPCDGRNWVAIWARVDRAPVGMRIHIYREWPCPGQYVPGEGDLGMWAEPGEKLDGEKGPAQKPLGWGHKRYREEFWRLEGKSPAAIKAASNDEDDFVFDDRDSPSHAEPKTRRRVVAEGGEDIYARIMDSRYAAKPTSTADGQTTLLEECEDLGFEPDFEAASGKQISEGTYLINDLLRYDREQDVTTLNSPRLFVHRSCRNTIFAMQNWTGEDGQHGACKDFVDTLRYLVLYPDLDDFRTPGERIGRNR